MDPVLPPFQPKRIPGPQLAMDRSYSPLQLFQLFFTTSVLETIVKNTNSYGAIMRSSAGKKFHWVPLTVSEFFAFISLVLYMGRVKVKTYVDYWARKSIYSFSYPQQISGHLMESSSVQPRRGSAKFTEKRNSRLRQIIQNQATVQVDECQWMKGWWLPKHVLDLNST